MRYEDTLGGKVTVGQQFAWQLQREEEQRERDREQEELERQMKQAQLRHGEALCCPDAPQMHTWALVG